MFYFDNHGWLTSVALADRSTNIDPEFAGERVIGQPYPNFTGAEWMLREYLAPPPPAAPPASPTEWLIDVGPFFDRFGAAKLVVLTSSDPGVRAILTDLQVRKWIDLQREDVFIGLQHVGAEVPAVTAEIQQAILSTPVSPVENLALRKLYFS